MPRTIKTSRFPLISCFYTWPFQCLKLLILHRKRPKSMYSNSLSTTQHSKLKKIQGLFKEKWNSRTFQGLPLKFKEISRLCEPWYIENQEPVFYSTLTVLCLLNAYPFVAHGDWVPGNHGLELMTPNPGRKNTTKACPAQPGVLLAQPSPSPNTHRTEPEV